jgi:hypothetical protein
LGEEVWRYWREKRSGVEEGRMERGNWDRRFMVDWIVVVRS